MFRFFFFFFFSSICLFLKPCCLSTRDRRQKIPALNRVEGIKSARQIHSHESRRLFTFQAKQSILKKWRGRRIIPEIQFFPTLSLVANINRPRILRSVKHKDAGYLNAQAATCLVCSRFGRRCSSFINLSVFILFELMHVFFSITLSGKSPASACNFLK